MGIKHAVDETFFDNWSPAMAYVLGFIYADGSIDRCQKIRASYLNIGSTDREILNAIKDALQSKHIIRERKYAGYPRKFSQKKQYLFRIGSNYLCDTLESLGVFPHKSLTIQLPFIPSGMLGHFARGYFDGDGCVFLEKQKGRTAYRLRVIFTSGSKLFLQQLEAVIREELLLQQRSVYDAKRAFQLMYSTKDSLKLFDFMYKKPYDDLYLKRKKDLFDQYVMASSPSG